MKKFQHNMSCDHLTSFDMGELIPVGVKEVWPGDIVQMSTTGFLRTSPLLAPVMQRCYITIHHWFVPFRLIWEDFFDCYTGGPANATTPVWPTIVMPNSGAGGVGAGSLANYLGVPLGYNADNTGYSVSVLPFRAYVKLWNENYRDEDLQSAAALAITSNVDAVTDTAIQRVCWQKDYYTTARPWPQKGPEVTLPLGTRANVLGIGKATATFNDGAQTVRESDGTSTNYADSALIGSTADDVFYVQEGITGTSGTSDYPNIWADLSNATAASITGLRLANAAQRFGEWAARHGSRVPEFLRKFGVKSSDARLQRPEYLGGGKQTIQFSEVLQTAQVGGTGVGNMAGHGIGALRSNRFVRFFEEPGYIMSVAYVQPTTLYTQGLRRHWNYRTKFDLFHPELQFIGQQAVLNKEIYAPHTMPEGTFGYQDRYDHLRRSEGWVSGEFASTLNYWHFSREFFSDPTLNGDFVESVPRYDAFQDEGTTDPIYFQVYHNIRKKSLVVPDPRPKLL